MQFMSRPGRKQRTVTVTFASIFAVLLMLSTSTAGLLPASVFSQDSTTDPNLPNHLYLPLVQATNAQADSEAAVTAANVTLTTLNTDPYGNTTSQHKTEVEPDSFSFGSTI